MARYPKAASGGDKGKEAAAVLFFIAAVIIASADGALAGASPKSLPHSEIITNELDCTRPHTFQNGEVVWENICYSPSDQGPSAQERAKIIEQTLNEGAGHVQASGEVSKEGKAQADAARQYPPLKTASAEATKNADNLSVSKVTAKKPADNRQEESFDRGAIALEKEGQRFEFGAETYYFVYKEPIFNLKDRGEMYSVFGTYTIRPPESDALLSEVVNMYKVEGRYGYGTVDYTSDPSGSIDDITDYTFELRALLGKDFYFNDQARVTPFAGFGFRYLNDDTGGKQSTTGAWGYERESRYFYAPAGMEFTHRFGSGWRLNLSGEYDFFIEGLQKSHLTDVSSGFPELDNKQRHGFGARGALKLVKEAKNINFLIEPFARYWHIEDSDTATEAGNLFIVTGLEPENKTTEFGLRLGIEY